MRYAFEPSQRSAQPCQGVGLPAMLAGGIYEVEASHAALVCESYPGLDGNPCLIPLDNTPGAAAAAFIAAISEPTPHNPETPPPAVSTDVVEPVKRGRGRPPRVPA